MAELFVIVGLGNPGPRYTRTWHNCGFMALEYLSQRAGIPIRQAKHRSLIGRGSFAGQSVLLVQPQTYMNESGLAVREIADYYHVPLDHVLVVYDDLDTPRGQIRLRPGGGPGTHNGMRSILQHLGSGDFARMRIGIGPKPAAWDLADFVLSEIPKADQEAVFHCLEISADGVERWLTQGIEAAMNYVNRSGRPPKPKKEKRPEALAKDEAAEAATSEGVTAEAPIAEAPIAEVKAAASSPSASILPSAEKSQSESQETQA